MDENLYRKIFSKNLKYYMSINDKTQIDIINDLGINKSAISTWCNGTRLPRMDKIDMLAKYFHINRSDLIEEKSDLIAEKNNTSDRSPSKGVVINVYGRVAAGIPLEMIEDIIDTEEIPEEMAKAGEYFGLKIHGNSMEPRMKEGDTVIIRKQEDAETGDIVIVTVDGTDATCKQIKKYRDGIALIPFNPTFAPLFFTNQEIKERPVCIIGKVVELRAKF